VTICKSRALALASSLLVLACSEPPALVATAEPWPEADALFHQDPRWLGADDAYSVDLGGGRVLWLFGDSFVATSDAHVRSASRLVRNSVAIQSGYDPASASISFFWGGDAEGPASFFPEQGDTWFWPGDGERIGDELVLFLMAVRPSNEGLGFEVTGSKVFVVPNPDDDPPAWKLEPREMPASEEGVVVGSASVFALDDDLYAFGSREPPPHDIHLTRFARDSSGRFDFMRPEPLGLAFEDGQTELSVHRDPGSGLFIEVQTEGFGASDLAFRTARDLRGPYSELEAFYHPPESDRGDAFVYAAKAHPHLEAPGADFASTYASNSFDFATLVADGSLYFPRFVRVSLGRR